MSTGPFQSRDAFLGDVRAAVDAQLQPASGDLTPREIEVLRLLCAGRTVREVALALDISIRTAEQHRTNLANKTGCSTGIELGAWAERNGYLGGVHVGR